MIYIYYIYVLHIMSSTCSGLRMLWTLIWLLSSGIAGNPKEVYNLSWYSYRNRAILSGSTESTAYLPSSPALPCRIISHLKAWYPRLWLPPPARECVIKRRTLARFQMLILMPAKSLLDVMWSSLGARWYQRSALRGTLFPVLWSVTSQSSLSSPSSIRAENRKVYEIYHKISKICQI